MDLKELVSESLNWIFLTQDRKKYWAVVKH